MLPSTKRDITCRNICIVILALLVSTVADDSFLGGAITYNLEEKAGTKIAHLELTTGWEYGQGRCGPACYERSLNINISNGGNLFASFSKIVFDKHTHRNNQTSINDSVQRTAAEQVIAFNQENNWEQDRMTFAIELGIENDLTLQIEGNNWSSDIKGGPVRWKLQAKIPTRVRTDTNQANRSPVVHIKPIHRVKLNTESTIKLTVNDADDDITKCEKANKIQAGEVFDKSGTHITVDKETCAITVNATTLNGFKDKDRIPVTLKLMDYNKNLIKLGTETMKPNAYSLGFTAVQFVIHVTEKLETPYFVRPTAAQSHVYILYIGATWKTVIYAASTADSKITNIIPYGFKNEILNVSELSNNRRENVKSADIQWKPLTSQIGSRVLCVKAVDDKGEESEDHRCFKAYVKGGTYNHSSEVDNKKPYFVNVPSSDQLVNCKIGATCLLPIYVNSSSIVDKVMTTSSFVEEANIGVVEYNVENRLGVYVATLAFSHPTFGKNEICMIANDVNGIHSEEVCINVFIEPPDPCLSVPCVNAGKCTSNKIDGTFVCDCRKGLTGKRCETKLDYCQSNPCEHGVCHKLTGRFYCSCHKGYSGTTCETNKDDCKDDSCHFNGICKDDVNTFGCDCYDRYTGDNCTKNSCPEVPTEELSCPEDGCFPDPCTGHGVCSAGGICTCLMGYNTDINCSMAIGDLNVTGVEFVQPSPKNRSQHICVSQPNAACKMSLYLAHESRGVPSVRVISTTDQLKTSITVEQPKLTNIIEGMDNIYSVDISIPTNLAEKVQQYACFMATIGSSNTTMCYDFKFTTESSHNSATTTTQFVAPTPEEGTKVKCYKDERCLMLLFTTSVNQSCEDVISSTPRVTVIQTKLMTDSCVTEVTYSYPNAGPTQLYFQSSKENYQLRKFELEVLLPDSDPCASFPCQNGGHCFPNSGGYHCICTKSYIGNYCEKGPCPTNNCVNNAYCQINNGTEVCICPAGFHGGKCESSILQPGKEMEFIGIALPRTFTCVVYQPCSFPLFSTSSSISPGYVSYVLQLNQIQVTKLEDSGEYMVSVRLISTQEGVHDVCLQTIDANQVNKDEICVKVNTVTDMLSLYGQRNLPHFIEPSLPTDAEVECVEGQPCHIIYRITHGDSNTNDKVIAMSTEDFGFDTYYIYSDCQLADGSVCGNCTVDVSIVTDSKNVNVSRRFCVRASIATSGVNGEERCFSVTVVGSSAVVPVGCQSLECHNGGFCDGHEPSSPICYCRRGFSGMNCKQGVSPQAIFGGQVQTPFYIGQLGIPAEIHCLVKRLCVIPFQIVATSGQTQAPDIFLGYVDPSIAVEEPSVNAGSKSNGVFFGSTTGVPLAAGVFKVCLQSLSVSKILIEMCLDVLSVDSVEEEVDLTKPHFLEPTVPTETLLLCEVSKACHIDIHFTNGDAFDFPGDCPRFTETSPEHFDGLHVFKSEYGASGCTSDVSYIPTSVNVTHTFCIQLAFPGKKGENRCFRIQVVSDLSQNVTHPCTGMSCDNNGKCIADFNVTPAEANCICPFGYDGEHCEKVLMPKGRIVGTEALEAKLDKGQRFDDNSAVPNMTRCYETEPCCLTVLYNGDSKKPPVLGSYNASLDVKELVANTPDVTLPTRHIAEVCVEGQIGKHQLCLQTTTDGTKDGIVTDELCFGIEIVAGGIHQNQALPHFTNSLSNGSRLSCNVRSNCHLSMLTEKSTDMSCEQVRECDGGVSGSYVYHTLEVEDKCITDIVVKTGELHHADEICLTAGSDGERRVLTLESTCPLEFGHCDHSHCLNVGRCLSGEPTEALCVCDKQFTGASCDKVKVTKTPVTEEELENARNSTLGGDGACHCFVKEKEDKSPTTMAFVKSGGIGAGGMASAMGIGGVIYGIIKKIRKPAALQNKVAPKSKGTSVKPDKKSKN